MIFFASGKQITKTRENLYGHEFRIVKSLNTV